MHFAALQAPSQEASPLSKAALHSDAIQQNQCCHDTHTCMPFIHFHHLQVYLQAPSQEVSLLPKTAARSDAIQLTAIASGYDPTPARRGDGTTPAKSVSFRDVSTFNPFSIPC